MTNAPQAGPVEVMTIDIEFLIGGARRDRTADLNTASVALSRLSYGPTWEVLIIRAHGGEFNVTAVP